MLSQHCWHIYKKKWNKNFDCLNYSFVINMNGEDFFKLIEINCRLIREILLMFKFKKTPISCWRRQLDVNKKFMMLIFCRVSVDWMSHIRSAPFTVLLIFCFVLLFLLHIQNGEDKSHRFCFPPTSFLLKLFSVYWLFVSASQLVNTFVYVTKFTLRFVFIINTAKKTIKWKYFLKCELQFLSLHSSMSR